MMSGGREARLLLCLLVSAATLGRSVGDITPPVTKDTVIKLPSQPYDFLYKEGVAAYLSNDFETCAKYLEEALQDWHWIMNNVARCRKICSKESESAELFSAALTDDDKFYERAVRNTLCVTKCKKDVFGDRMDRVVETHVKVEFEERKPYDYLQLCYYKLGRVKEAADAAATVLSAQPDHKVMPTNLQYYINEAEIKVEDIVNLELKEYGKEYIKGTVAYENGDYKTAITIMEKSLSFFYESYEDCRFLCENPFDQGWYPDFIASIANHYTYTLRCKRRCLWQLSDLYGEIDDDFFPSYFNYLQYSYYQVGNTKKASEAVESYLVLSPEDETQNRNKQFYITQENVPEEFFVPRKDVVAFKEREDFEEKFLEFIETNFAFLNEDDDEGDVEHKTDALADSDSATNTSAVEEGLKLSTVSMAEDDTAKVEL